MATTKLSNIINPEVMGDMIEAKINAQAKLTPYAKVDTTLQGVPGDTKTVPAWNYIGDAEDFDPESGNEMDTANLTATSTQFKIKCAGKSVGIYQTAINSGLGNPIGQAETQLAKSIIGKVDNDVLDAAYTSANVVNKSSAAISYAPIVDCVTKFEDEEDGIDKVMFIHPKQETQLLKDSNFLSADKFQAGVAVNGSIGKIAGCWIKKSKKVKELAAATEVKGVYTLTISTALASGDKIVVGGKEYTFTDGTTTANAQATAIAGLFASDDTFTVTASTKNVVFTQKVGGTGAMPTLDTTGLTTGAATIVTTTAGVAEAAACYVCPIIKMEPDSAETEYTEDELPAITIFLKKDTQVDHEWFPKKQKHDITAAKYYGVALTNAAKVVVAKFGK